MVTQVMIAERVGLDVSSVNKILNRKSGPKFKDETIRKVRRAAKELGYKFNPRGKKAMADFIEKMFPTDEEPSELAKWRGVPIEWVKEAHQLLGRN